MLISDLYVIGTNLQNIRKKSHLTQWDVADIAGISSRTYADIERGTVNPRLDTLVKICQALHITPNDLLMSTEPAPKNIDETLNKQIGYLSDSDKEFLSKVLSLYLFSP